MSGYVTPCFSAAIAHLKAGLLITDPGEAGNPIIFANSGFSTLTGYSQEEILGHSCRFLQGPETDQQSIEEMRIAIAERRTFEGILLNYRKDGTPFWNELVISPVFDSNGKLINYVGLQSDVTARQQAQLRRERLSGRLLQVQDDERKRIADELHERIAQDLATLHLQLQRLGAASSLDHELFDTAIELSRRCLDDAKTLSYSLHPPLLDILGLSDALGWLIQSFIHKTGMSIEFDSDPELVVPVGLAMTIFRIAQEGLLNVFRHAGQTQASMALFRGLETIVFEIRDYGKGMKQPLLEAIQKGTITPGLGLLGVRERIRQSGGIFEMESSGRGTVLRAVFPSGGPL